MFSISQEMTQLPWAAEFWWALLARRATDLTLRDSSVLMTAVCLCSLCLLFKECRTLTNLTGSNQYETCMCSSFIFYILINILSSLSCYHNVKIGSANYSVAAGFYNLKEFIRTINISTYLHVTLNFIYQILRTKQISLSYWLTWLSGCWLSQVRNKT